MKKQMYPPPKTVRHGTKTCSLQKRFWAILILVAIIIVYYMVRSTRSKLVESLRTPTDGKKGSAPETSLTDQVQHLEHSLSTHDRQRMQGNKATNSFSKEQSRFTSSTTGQLAVDSTTLAKKMLEGITIEEGLIHLAVKLSRASREATTSSDSISINSAYREVIELVDELTELRSVSTMCLNREHSRNHCEQSASKNITVVVNLVHVTLKTEGVKKCLSSIFKFYPNIRVVVGIPDDSLEKEAGNNSNVDFIKMNNATKETDVWKSLFSKVSTEYVYVARDIAEFSNYTRLEYLLDSLTSTVAMAVSSSSKELHTGEWSDGCYQTLFQNFELKYSKGYHVSLKSCLVCQHLSTPFLTYTKLLAQQHPLPDGMTATSGFSIWFLDLLKSDRVVLSCPSSMAYTQRGAELSTQHNEWLDLVKYHQVEHIYLPDGARLLYSCDEAKTHCQGDQPPGLARSKCCLNQLADGVQTVMKKCEDAGLYCQVTDGTILGTLKFESSLPWEIDADIEIEQNNVTVFNRKVAGKLKSLGYSVASHKGYHTMHQPVSGWMIELFHISSPGSARLKASGFPVTRVSLDGHYISTCESPGLLGRNRYGHEIYQHANHWSKGGASSSWAFYKPGVFASCTKPGHHSCLDQLRADGSMQFSMEKLEP